MEHVYAPRMSSSPCVSLSGQVVRREYAGRRIETWQRHRHPDFELTWIEAGVLEFDFGRRRPALEATAGACIILPPDFEITPRTRAAVLHQVAIPPAAMEEASELLGHETQGPREPLVLGADDRLGQLVRLFMQETESGLPAGDPGVAALSNAVVYGLARAAVRRSRSGAVIHRRIRRALAAVANRYQERLSVDDLAAEAGMNRFSFLRSFRAAVGTSPYQYLTAFRLDRAAEQLRASEEASVLDIALACGFTDPSRFARAFRARYGRAPRHYRAGAAG